jgi:hypothetical protein
MGPIDRAYVEIIPDLKRFSAQTKAGVAAAMTDVKRNAKDAGDALERDFEVAGRRASSSVNAIGRDARQVSEKIDRLKPNIHIETNSGEVVAELAAVDSAVKRVGNSGGTARSNLGLLATAVLSLGSAVVPVAAVAAGLGVGLVAAAGTAALAIKGVQTEMKAGTILGLKYKSGLDGLNTEFQTLQHIAAANLLGPFQLAIRQLTPQFPRLNRDVGALSTQLGTIASHVLPGLLSLFSQLTPLLLMFGNYVNRGAAAFQHWAQSGTGVTGFVTYIRTQLPLVLDTFRELAVTAAHLIVALAPMGTVVLSAIRGLSAAINSIPISVLRVLAPAVVAVVLAFAALKKAIALGEGITLVIAKLAEWRASVTGSAAAAQVAAAETVAGQRAIAASAAETAAVQVRSAAKMSESFAVIGADTKLTSASYVAMATTIEAESAAIAEAAALAAASIGRLGGAMAGEAGAAGEAAAANAAFAGSTRATGAGAGMSIGKLGAMATGIGLVVVGAWEGAKALDAFVSRNRVNIEKTGGSFKTMMTDMVNSSKAGWAEIEDSALRGQLASTGLAQKLAAAGLTVQEAMTALKGGTITTAHFVDKWRELGDPSDDTVGKFTAVGIQFNGAATAADRASTSIGGLSASQTRLAGASDRARAAAAAQKAAMAASTQTMREAGDAAGLLQQAFDLLNGETLDVSDAEVSFRGSVLGAVDSLKQNGKSLALSTKAGVANTTAINAAIRAAQAHSDAISKSTGSTAKGTAAYVADLKILRQRIKDVGGNTSAIDAMIRSMGRVPKVVKTVAEVAIEKAKAAVAEIQRRIDGFTHAHHRASVDVRTLGVGAAQQVLDNLVRDRIAYIQVQVGKSLPGRVNPGFAGGGWIGGRGTATSDSNLVRASPGEFLVNAQQSKKHGALVQSINDGTFDRDPTRFVNRDAVPGQARAAAATQTTVQVRIDRADLAAAFNGMLIRFDGDGLARLVTSRQDVTAIRGPRR